MKQMYAIGPFVSPSSAAVRAVTLGVGPAEVEAALAFANYAPPPGDADRPLPVRLALLNSPVAGRTLTHVAPSRNGFFAHTLVNVPATADAQLAIQTWGSPQWQRTDPDSTADLPELPYLPVADVLDDAALKKWLATPTHRDVLEFVLAALLGTQPHARITVAAPADDMATVVYAVTRVLPPGLLDDFTFSTYEPDPANCSARLIGHDPGAADGDLPGGCYDAGFGFHPGTGRKTPLPADVPFAAFAVAKLANGEFGPLDELKASWARLGLKDARQFDLVFRLARGTGVLTKEEAAEALQHPPLAAWVSARQDALTQFLDWALEDREFATAAFSRAVQALRAKPEITTKLAQTVRDHGLKALQTGDRTRMANALEVILPMVAPAKANAVWGELATTITDADALPWEVRTYLLPRFVRFKQQQGVTGVDPGLARWIDVPAERLADLLALDLPKGYHLAAARATAGRDGEPSATLARTLAQHPALTLRLLQPATTPADKAVALFDTLLKEAPAHPWFEDLLAHASDYPAGLRNKFFEAALAAGKVDADRVVRTQGPQLLDLFAGQSGLDKVGAQVLANPPADLLGNPAVLGFLTKLLDDDAVTDGTKARVRSVRAVKYYLDHPTFTADDTKPVAEALTLTPAVLPATAKAEVFAAVARAVANRADGDAVQHDLEAALVAFGDVLANDPADFTENLLRDLRGRLDIARHPNLVHAFLAVSLGAAKAPELAGKLDGLDVHAFAVAREAAKKGGGRLIADLDRRTADWPKAARTQWGFLAAAVRPRGAAGVLRDVGLFAGGAAAASLAWWVVKLAG